MEAESSNKNWIILVQKDGKEIARVPLTREKTLIGRMSQNQVVLDHGSVSRSHALVQLIGEQFFIIDQGSQNGTLLNGKEIVRDEFKTGDIVSIGPFTLKRVPGQESGK